jgi:hypothetical protein
MPNASTSTWPDINYESSQLASQSQSQQTPKRLPSSPQRPLSSSTPINPQFSPSQLSSISLSSADTYYSAIDDKMTLLSEPDRQHVEMPTIDLPSEMNANTYDDYLSRVTNRRFISLAKLSQILDKANSNAFADEILSSWGFNVFAIVNSIASASQSIKVESNRVLHLIDPTLVGDAGRIGLTVFLRESIVHIPAK